MSSSVELDKKLILLTQQGLPLTQYPYQELAKNLQVEEQQVIDAINLMLLSGQIRRIGLVPNQYALGYRFNIMTVWDVDDDNIVHLGQQIGQLPFVSHCYQRPRKRPEWPYNLFAMVHGKSKEEVSEKIDTIESILGASLKAKDQLNSIRILKKTGIRLKE